MVKLVDLGSAVAQTNGAFFATVHSEGSVKKTDVGSSFLYATKMTGPNEAKVPVDE